MNTSSIHQKTQTKVRTGTEKRVTSDDYKAKMAEGFAAVAKRMDAERSKQL